MRCPRLWGRALRNCIGVWQDFHGERIELMDRCGVAFAILSLNGPAVQAKTETARRSIWRGGRTICWPGDRQTSDRLGGFAALPMQDPEAAIRELERAVVELGLLGPT